MSRATPTVATALRTCLLLAAACAGVLKAADYVPSMLAGTPHDARVYWTLAEAEAGIGRAIWVPSAYPLSVAWPPARIDEWPIPPRAVAVHFDSRSGAKDVLILVESLDGETPPPPALLPPVETLMTVPDVPLGRRSGTMARETRSGGHVLHDLWWTQGGRRIVMRYTGPVEDLLLMAGSLERGHP